MRCCGGGSCVALLVVVVCAWLLGDQAGARLVRGGCEPHGWWADKHICLCHDPYTPIGLQRILFDNSFGLDHAQGFNATQVTLGRCSRVQLFLDHLFVGKRNKHASVRPFNVRDDAEALLQDAQVRHILGDNSISVALGAFKELQPHFPTCTPPTFDAKASINTEDGAQIASNFVERCKAKWQWAKQFHSPDNAKSLALAAWLSFRPDQQRFITINCNDIGYIGGWYESVMTQGLNAVVLHDCVPPEIVDVLQNDFISFKRVELNTSSDIHFRQTPNDVRFVLFSEFLDAAPMEYEYIIATDLHDVRFRRNPFSAMRSRRDIEIFIGADKYAYENNPFTWEVLSWCAPAYALLPYDQRFGNAITLNCGVVGGQGPAMRRLLRHVVALFRARDFDKPRGLPPWSRYCDMAMFAIALMTGYDTLQEDPWVSGSLDQATLKQPYRFDSGAPFTSTFGVLQDTWPNYVIHK